MDESNLNRYAIGNYEILSELGRGGMAVVYKAYQRNLDRYVARRILAKYRKVKQKNMSQEAIRHQTLIVSRNWAKCGNCGKGADLHDKRHLHLMAVSYVWTKPDEKPFGVELKYLASDFADLQGEFEKRVREMRPDLEWIGLVNW